MKDLQSVSEVTMTSVKSRILVQYQTENSASDTEHCVCCHCRIDVKKGRYVVREGSYCTHCYESSIFFKKIKSSP